MPQTGSFPRFFPRFARANIFDRDKSETLAQNYRRLGLAARLRAPTGGTEKKLGHTPSSRDKDPLAVKNVEQAAVISEAKVERDEDGKIIRVIHGRANPLNDPLNALDSDSEMEDEKEYEEWGGIRENGTETDVVKELMAEARNPVEKKPRYLSEREKEWLESLVAKYGDDYGKMARDRRLNPMQQTSGDLKKRIERLK